MESGLIRIYSNERLSSLSFMKRYSERLISVTL